MDIESFLKPTLLTKNEVDRFLLKNVELDINENNSGWTFDPDLGFILKNSIRQDGVEGSKTFYHYTDRGARLSPNFPTEKPRINTYGDSFTHCDQVSDGETWQEYLGAHLAEPLGNYGVGGYSVYQAYLRMLKIENQDSADYVIFNIWSDDHFRSLDWIRGRIRNRRVSPCSFTLPYLLVNLAAGKVEEAPNICGNREDFYKLTDLAAYVDTFREDPLLNLTLSEIEWEKSSAQKVPVTYGLPLIRNPRQPEKVREYVEAALLSSRRILEWTEAFCKKQGLQLMVILSHSRDIILQRLQGNPDWDQSFRDFLKTRNYPVIDLRDDHEVDFRTSKLDPDSYLERYYIGHYNPAGNFFFSQSIRNRVVEWLDPKPMPYR